MIESNCEQFLMAKMAELDGEAAEISADKLNAHFAACESCRSEFEQIRGADNLLKRQTRRETKADLWSGIEEEIGAKRDANFPWKLFALFGAILLGYKFFQIFSEQNLVLIFNFVSLGLIAALFVFLKENPFKINAGLNLEK